MGTHISTSKADAGADVSLASLAVEIDNKFVEFENQLTGFEIDADGLASARSTYDNEAKGFVFYATDTEQYSQKKSATSADWTSWFDYGPLTGSTGSDDNRILRSDGTGGKTVQPSGLTLDDSNNLTGVATLGVGTTAVPHGGIGHALFAMEGPAGASGPFMQITNATDDYPIYSAVPFAHDNMSLNFDAYYSSGDKSSDAGSNFQLAKTSDSFRIRSSVGNAQGAAVTWTDNLTANTSGYIGIGTTSAGAPLTINRGADGVIVDIKSADTVEGSISVSGNTTSYNAFCGSHYTQLLPDQQELPVGAVVVATGQIIPNDPVRISSEASEVVIKEEALELVPVMVKSDKLDVIDVSKALDPQSGRIIDKPTFARRLVDSGEKQWQLKAGVELDGKTGKFVRAKQVETVRDVSGVEGKEYFPYIDTTTKAADPRVYGVWHGKLSDDAKGQSFGQDDLPVYLISQVGLFKVRVTDTNGDIANGDWLETSKRPMEAQKQDTPQKLNSTLGKALVDVKWDDEPKDKKLGYRWKLIPVIF